MDPQGAEGTKISASSQLFQENNVVPIDEENAEQLQIPACNKVKGQVDDDVYPLSSSYRDIRMNPHQQSS